MAGGAGEAFFFAVFVVGVAAAASGEAAFFFEFGFELGDVVAAGFGAVGVDLEAEASAVFAPAVGAVEGEEAGVEFFEGGAAAGAAHFGVEDLDGFVGEQEAEGAFAHFDGLLDEGAEFEFVGAFVDLGDDGVDGVLFEALELFEVEGALKLAVDEEGFDAVLAGVVGDFGVEAFAGFDERGHEVQAAFFREGSEGLYDGGDALLFDGEVALGAVLGAELGEQKAEEVPDFGDGGDGGFAAAAGDALFDGDGGGDAGDEVHFGFFHLLDKGAGVDGHGVEEAALAFSEDEVEGEGGFAGAAEAGDDDEFVAGDFDGDIFEVVLASASDCYGVRCSLFSVADAVGGGLFLN